MPYFLEGSTLPKAMSMLFAQALLVSACASTSTNSSHTPTPPLSTHSELQTTELLSDVEARSTTLAPLLATINDGGQALPLGDNIWLLTSESRGLLVLDSTGAVLSGLTGHYRFFDTRIEPASTLREGQANKFKWVLAVNHNNNAVQLIKLVNNKLTVANELGDLSFEVDHACLYRDPLENLYANVIDGRGQAQQWLIWNGVDDSAVRQLVRKLPLPGKSASCGVDDQRNVLYVIEEELGVWAYGADPESPLERELVDLSAPRGGLTGELKGLAITDNGITLLDADHSTTLHYAKTADGHFKLIQQNKLHAPEPLTPENITINHVEGKIITTVINGEDGRYWYAMSIDEPTNIDSSSLDTLESFAYVTPSAQTASMPRFGDTADDPAIWLHPKNPKKSLIFGTNKRSGLMIYDLQGKLVQSIATGRLNNVDIRHSVLWQSEETDLAIATLRNNDTLAVYTIEPSEGRTKESLQIKTTLDEIYGTCMYQANTGETYVFANDKQGLFQQYRIDNDGATLVREFRVQSQPEGCVADDAKGLLFVGEEDVGIWTIGANPEDGNTLTVIHRVGKELVDDVEGLALYLSDDNRYLVVSSQGNDSYVIYDADAPYSYRGRFKVGLNANKLIDGSSETDGLEASSHNFGGIYSAGMLVVQDGRNNMPQAPQNFKIIPWKDIAKALNL